MSVGGVPTVFIIDDDAGVREAIQDLVESVELQAEAFATARDFLASARRDGPSCLVLDVRLPDTSGLDLQQKLSRAGVRIPIIFITGHADIPMTVKAMKSGAVEFLTKPFREQDLLDVIHRALKRDRRAREKQRQLAELQKRYSTLSARESEVMSLVVSGLLNKQVGAELGISEVTVKAHRGMVMRKMKAPSLPDLVYMSTRLGLAPLGEA